MAKVYSYPRVTMSTLAKKHSHNVINVPDTTILFAPLVTEKGPTDKLVKVHSLSEFIDVFGSLNEEFYDLNGQMALNVYNWLSNGGTLFVKRLLLDNTVARGIETTTNGKYVIKEISKADNIIYTSSSQSDINKALFGDEITLIEDNIQIKDSVNGLISFPVLQNSENANIRNIINKTSHGAVDCDPKKHLCAVKVIDANNITFSFSLYVNEYLNKVYYNSDEYSIDSTTKKYKKIVDQGGASPQTTDIYLEDVADFNVDSNAANVKSSSSTGDTSRGYDEDGNLRFWAKETTPLLSNFLSVKIEKSSYEVYAKYEGEYYSNLELHIERVSPANKDGVYNFTVNYIDLKGRKTSLERFAQKTLKNYKSALNSSMYINGNNIEINNVLNGLSAKNASKTIRLDSQSFSTTEKTYSDTIEKIKLFWTPGKEKNCEYFLSNRLETPIDLIFDAGYPADIKASLIDFVNNAEDKVDNSIRPDIVLILDEYSLNNSLRLALPESSGTYQDSARLAATTFNPTNIAIYEQYFTINDAIFTNQDLYVTPTYFLSKLIPYNDNTYGMQYPTAGLRRGILADALYVNENPDAERKDEWFEKRVNYVEKSAREYAFMSQRTCDGSTDMEYTALSFLNNERVLEKIKKEIETLARSYLHEFNDSVTIANMTNVLNKYVANWIANRTLSLGVVEVVQNAVSENALDINLNIRFTNTIEVINVSIVIE